MDKVEFKVYGRYALFTDPLTKIGGEKCSYHVPTYEAMKGVAKSIYWKPSFIWCIDKVRVIKRVRMESKSAKPLRYQGGGNDLSIYAYLADVEYQVQAHLEWNFFRDDQRGDRDFGKHLSISQRMIGKGGYQDIFLGTRECQGYVIPCKFGEGRGFYDDYGDLSFGVMFHSFGYPDEIGKPELHRGLWKPVMRNGVIEFPGWNDEAVMKTKVRDMVAHPPALREVESAS